MNDKNTKAALIIIIFAVIIIIVAVVSTFFMQDNVDITNIAPKNNTEESNTEVAQSEYATEETTETLEEVKVELTDDLKLNAENLAKECQKKYEDGLAEGKYISSYSYLYDLTQKSNIETQDLENVPENAAKAAIHLFRPADVRQYLKNQPDVKELCVYTAIATNEGILLSSKNGSGTITFEQYKELVLSYSPDNNGMPENPKKNTQKFNEITDAVTKATGFSDYELKHLACNEKYAVFVMGYAKKPDFIKECVMEKKDDGWEITYFGIESKPTAKAEINAMYPDFDMALLPVYDIYSFISQYGITTSAPNAEKKLIEKGLLKSEDLPLVYTCGTGNFIYMEGATGSKVLGYKNASSQLEAFPVSNTFEAITIMREKEENPPVFIIKMNDDMVK